WNICREPYRGDLERFRPPERMNLFLHVKSEHQQFVAMYSWTMHYEGIFHGRLAEADARRYFQQLIDGVDFCHKKRSLPLRLKGILITEGKTEFRKLLLFFVGISKWQPRKLEGNMELLSTWDPPGTDYRGGPVRQRCGPLDEGPVKAFGPTPLFRILRVKGSRHRRSVAPRYPSAGPRSPTFLVRSRLQSVSNGKEPLLRPPSPQPNLRADAASSGDRASSPPSAARRSRLAALIGRATGRRGPSMLVHETAALQLQRRRADWAHSRPVLVLDIAWNVDRRHALVLCRGEPHQAAPPVGLPLLLQRRGRVALWRAARRRGPSML
ncbi:hypothetical protein ACJX0J_042475, partial [Zea mays]